MTPMRQENRRRNVRVYREYRGRKAVYNIRNNPLGETVLARCRTRARVLSRAWRAVLTLYDRGTVQETTTGGKEVTAFFFFIIGHVSRRRLANVYGDRSIATVDPNVLRESRYCSLPRSTDRSYPDPLIGNSRLSTN